MADPEMSDVLREVVDLVKTNSSMDEATILGIIKRELFGGEEVPELEVMLNKKGEEQNSKR